MDQSSSAPTGYAHPGYAASLAEFGTPRLLPRSRGSILVRDIPGTDARDAIGCYPLFACGDWSELGRDLADLGNELVALSLVADPFGGWTPEDLRRWFPDLARPFKEHRVVELARPFAAGVSRHHLRGVRGALRHLAVDTLDHDAREAFLDEWLSLHRHLVARHRLTGIRAFSRTAFAQQLKLPGAVVLRARHGAETVAALFCLVHGGVAYGHVIAATPDGHRLGAGYALYWSALEYFTGRVAWVDFGGVPADPASAPGLGRYKQGWSSTTRAAWLCGVILDRARYAELAATRRGVDGDFFPAYRGVFA